MNVFNNGLKTLLWSLGWQAAAMVIDYTLANLSLLNLEPEWTVILGLVLTAASKTVHNIRQKRKALEA